MSNQKQTSTEQPINREYAANEIVPKEARHINFLEYAMTWGGAALQPTVWTLGGTLICVGFVQGSLATILAVLISSVIIGMIGLIGFKTGASSTGALRCLLGIQGSKITSIGALISQCGWSAIGCYVGSLSLSYILSALFGLPTFGQAGGQGTLVLGVIIISVLTYLGTVIGGTKTLKMFETIMMIALLVFAGLITVALFKRRTWQELCSFKVPAKYSMSFSSAFNMMFVVCVTFATVVNDYTRYVKTAGTALGGNILGYSGGVYWFCAMGMAGPVVACLNGGVFDMENANPSSLCMQLGFGLPLLCVIIFSVVTTNMLDYYSSGMNIQNLFPRLNYRLCITIASVLIFVIAMIPIFLSSIYSFIYTFLDILGAIFPPLFAIILVDFYLIHKRKYAVGEINDPNGRFWFTKGFNMYAIFVWLLGAIIYTIFNKLNVMSNSVGFAITAMLVTAVIYYFVASFAVKKNYYKIDR